LSTPAAQRDQIRRACILNFAMIIAAGAKHGQTTGSDKSPTAYAKGSWPVQKRQFVQLIVPRTLRDKDTSAGRW
jgi:hypothetical protein